uniref:Uncharacterized protein n=1 Tax=Sphaerodactylus townsendi TaxID=933632 RepID=A0ACB8FLH5_9SAUR
MIDSSKKQQQQGFPEILPVGDLKPLKEKECLDANSPKSLKEESSLEKSRKGNLSWKSRVSVDKNQKHQSKKAQYKMSALQYKPYMLGVSTVYGSELFISQKDDLSGCLEPLEFLVWESPPQV